MKRKNKAKAKSVVEGVAPRKIAVEEAGLSALMDVVSEAVIESHRKGTTLTAPKFRRSRMGKKALGAYVRQIGEAGILRLESEDTPLSDMADDEVLKLFSPEELAALDDLLDDFIKQGMAAVESEEDDKDDKKVEEDEEEDKDSEKKDESEDDEKKDESEDDDKDKEEKNEADDEENDRKDESDDDADDEKKDESEDDDADDRKDESVKGKAKGKKGFGKKRRNESEDGDADDEKKDESEDDDADDKKDESDDDGEEKDDIKEAYSASKHGKKAIANYFRKRASMRKESDEEDNLVTTLNDDDEDDEKKDEADDEKDSPELEEAINNLIASVITAIREDEEDDEKKDESEDDDKDKEEKNESDDEEDSEKKDESEEDDEKKDESEDDDADDKKDEETCPECGDDPCSCGDKKISESVMNLVRQFKRSKAGKAAVSSLRRKKLGESVVPYKVGASRKKALKDLFEARKELVSRNLTEAMSEIKAFGSLNESDSGALKSAFKGAMDSHLANMEKSIVEALINEQEAYINGVVIPKIQKKVEEERIPDIRMALEEDVQRYVKYLASEQASKLAGKKLVVKSRRQVALESFAEKLLGLVESELAIFPEQEDIVDVLEAKVKKLSESAEESEIARIRAVNKLRGIERQAYITSKIPSSLTESQKEKLSEALSEIEAKGMDAFKVKVDKKVTAFMESVKKESKTPITESKEEKQEKKEAPDLASRALEFMERSSGM